MPVQSVFVTTVERTLRRQDRPVFGSVPLLQRVAQAGVPIVYLGSDEDRAFLQQFPAGTVLSGPVTETLPLVQSRFPNTRLYFLGNNAGDDAAACVAAGVTGCLLNARPWQDRPFPGMITDVYSQEVQAKVLADLRGDASVPVPPQPHPMPHRTWVQQLCHTSAQLAFMASGLGQQLANLAVPKVDCGVSIPGRWDLFEQYVDDLTGTRRSDGNRITTYIDGPASFKAQFEAIDKARRFIHISNHTITSDQAGWEFARHLADAADRGCDVRVMYDTLGSSEAYPSMPTDPAVYQYLRDHGIQVVEHTPGAAYNHLTHRKIMTTDDGGDRHIGFIGGMNVGNEYRYLWHDVHARIEGPAVTDLERLLAVQWAQEGLVLPVDLTPQTPLAEGGQARIVGHVGRQDQIMKQVYLKAIDTAATSINIADPFFTDPDIFQHLGAAARRGVQVRLFFPRDNAFQPCQQASRSHYRELIEAGVEIYEYDGLPMSHAKVASFDGRLATIGSSNLDARSLFNNDEANLWSSDPRVAEDLDRRFFMPDMAHSVRMTDYRPSWRDRLWACFAPWL